MSIQAAFEAFHEENPFVFALMRGYARNLLDAGNDKLSISLITERIRWDSAVRTHGDGNGFKINNNFSALYARKLEQECPEFAGKFITRARKSL